MLMMFIERKNALTDLIVWARQEEKAVLLNKEAHQILLSRSSFLQPLMISIIQGKKCQF